MKEHMFDFKVHIVGKYVYMSAKDWDKVLELLNSVSGDWSVVEDKAGNQEFSLDEEVH